MKKFGNMNRIGLEETARELLAELKEMMLKTEYEDREREKSADAASFFLRNGGSYAARQVLKNADATSDYRGVFFADAAFDDGTAAGEDGLRETWPAQELSRQSRGRLYRPLRVPRRAGEAGERSAALSRTTDAAMGERSTAFYGASDTAARETSAEELSEVFRRDARRYDGAFEKY